jgi:hypothetical protein
MRGSKMDDYNLYWYLFGFGNGLETKVGFIVGH